MVDAFDAARAKLIEHQERTYTHAVVLDAATLDSWPLEKGDLTNRVCRAIVDAVREVRRTRARVTPAAILREVELADPKLAPDAIAMLEGTALAYEPDLEPVVTSIRERGACDRAMRVANEIAHAARGGRWADVQKALAKGATVRADGTSKNRIYTYAEAMAAAYAPTSKPLERVIRFEPRLDPIIRLIPKTRLVLGAATNVGKTSLLARFLRNAMRHGTPAALITCEDPVEQLGAKWLAEEATVATTAVADGRLDELERSRVEQAIGEARDARLWVVHVEDRSLEGVLAEMRALAALGVKLVGIDYLQAIRGDRSLKSAKERTDWNLNEIIATQNTLDLAMILTSQFSRDDKHGAPRPPRLSDLKESGDIENAATWALLAWREEESSEAPVIAKVAKVKDRTGIGKRVAWQRDEWGVLVDCDPPRGGGKGRRGGGKGRRRGEEDGDDWGP